MGTNDVLGSFMPCSFITPDFECSLAPSTTTPRTELQGVVVEILLPWNGTTLQDPHTSSVKTEGVQLKTGHLQYDFFLSWVLFLVLLWQSWYYHNAICHLSDGDIRAWMLTVQFTLLHLLNSPNMQYLPCNKYPPLFSPNALQLRTSMI